MKNLYNTLVQFGVELTENQLKLYYTPNVRFQSSSNILASFDIGDIYNKWTRLSIKVKDNEVTLYKNCAKVGASTITGNTGPLEVEPGANMYVGQGGENFNNMFTVSVFCSPVVEGFV